MVKAGGVHEYVQSAAVYDLFIRALPNYREREGASVSTREYMHGTWESMGLFWSMSAEEEDK